MLSLRPVPLLLAALALPILVSALTIGSLAADCEEGSGPDPAPNVRITLVLIHEPAEGPPVRRTYRTLVRSGDRGVSLDSGIRMPVPTTSYNTLETKGGKVVPVTSFTYQNLGMDAFVEAHVRGRDAIDLDLKAGFSLISEPRGPDAEASPPVTGTVKQQVSDLFLRDGETLRIASVDDLEGGVVHLDATAEILR